MYKCSQVFNINKKRNRQKEGPKFSLSTNSLLFECEPFVLAKSSVSLTNIGSCALQYFWEEKEFSNRLQKIRSNDKFQLASVASGVILPNTSINFLFSFKSDIEGIFVEEFILRTIPAVDSRECNSHLRLKGIVIAQENHISTV